MHQIRSLVNATLNSFVGRDGNAMLWRERMAPQVAPDHGSVSESSKEASTGAGQSSDHALSAATDFQSGQTGSLDEPMDMTSRADLSGRHF